jgi:hypothetical protein
MESIRDIAKSIIAEMEGVAKDFNPSVANHYRRLAIVEYGTALRLSPTRSREINEAAQESAFLYAEKAISLGISRERMDEGLKIVQDFWVPRLGKS